MPIMGRWQLCYEWQLGEEVSANVVWTDKLDGNLRHSHENHLYCESIIYCLVRKQNR